MPRVFVAAGGGGDALAASILHRALGGSQPATIATYAWDRLAVDPVPGPRSAEDFDGLSPAVGGNHVVTSRTAPRTPFGSALPRLAGELRDKLVLLDPVDGAVGMGARLAALVAAERAESVTVVDVGGDSLAQGDEPGLRSPLADALALAACARLSVPVTLLVAGPGVDGELGEAAVLDALGRRGPAFRLRPDDISPFRGILDWHPSEVSALLAAAALGRRGRVEVRDAGLAVDLSEHSAEAYAVPLTDALARNRLARVLVTTTTLAVAEQAARDVCGVCEIDYERDKVAKRWGEAAGRPATITPEVEAAVQAAEQAAAARGVDYVTFRRLAEAADLAPAAAARLRRHLLTTRPEQSVWPLWSVRPAGTTDA
jgi:hypothetical protein